MCLGDFEYVWVCLFACGCFWMYLSGFLFKNRYVSVKVGLDASES